MTTEQLEELKRLAEAVRAWGNCDQAWLDTSEDDPAAVVGHINEDGYTYPVATIDCDQYYAGQDSLPLAKFYAAANPSAILDLIRQLEEAQAENERLREALLCFYDAWSADRRSVQVTAIDTAKSALAKEPK